jgi:hypothetical protein
MRERASGFLDLSVILDLFRAFGWGFVFSSEHLFSE